MLLFFLQSVFLSYVDYPSLHRLSSSEYNSTHFHDNDDIDNDYNDNGDNDNDDNDNDYNEDDNHMMMTTLMTMKILGIGYGHKPITVEPWDRSLLPPGTCLCHHHPVYHQHHCDHHPVKQYHHNPGISISSMRSPS